MVIDVELKYLQIVVKKARRQYKKQETQEKKLLV